MSIQPKCRTQGVCPIHFYPTRLQTGFGSNESPPPAVKDGAEALLRLLARSNSQRAPLLRRPRSRKVHRLARGASSRQTIPRQKALPAIHHIRKPGQHLGFPGSRLTSLQKSCSRSPRPRGNTLGKTEIRPIGDCLAGRITLLCTARHAQGFERGRVSSALSVTCSPRGRLSGVIACTLSRAVPQPGKLVGTTDCESKCVGSGSRRACS